MFIPNEPYLIENYTHPGWGYTYNIIDYVMAKFLCCYRSGSVIFQKKSTDPFAPKPDVWKFNPDVLFLRKDDPFLSEDLFNRWRNLRNSPNSFIQYQVKFFRTVQNFVSMINAARENLKSSPEIKLSDLLEALTLFGKPNVQLSELDEAIEHLSKIGEIWDKKLLGAFTHKDMIEIKSEIQQLDILVSFPPESEFSFFKKHVKPLMKGFSKEFNVQLLSETPQVQTRPSPQPISQISQQLVSPAKAPFIPQKAPNTPISMPPKTSTPFRFQNPFSRK